MAAGFSVKDALNKNSKAGIDESPRARFRTKDISIFKMYRNDMNFYSVEQVEEVRFVVLECEQPCDEREHEHRGEPILSNYGAFNQKHTFFLHRRVLKYT